MVVLVPEGKETGFRLGGMESVTVTDKDQLSRFVATIKNSDIGILYIPSAMIPLIPAGDLKTLQKRGEPIVVPYEHPSEWGDIEPIISERPIEAGGSATGYKFGFGRR